MRSILFLFCVLFYSFGYSGNQSDDQKKVKAILESKTPTVWVFTGNSITQGALHTYGQRAFPEIFAERVRWEMRRGMDVVINTAISGNTSQNILDDFKLRVARFHPDVIILMIGTNDAGRLSIQHFENNLIQLVKEIRAIDAIPVLLTPNPIIISRDSGRKDLEQYVIKTREISKKNQVILVDNWTIWNTELQEKYQGEALTKLLDDPFHPNGLGHQELAISLFKALFIFDENSPSCRIY